jgi:hypothetical protein
VGAAYSAPTLLPAGATMATVEYQIEGSTQMQVITIEEIAESERAPCKFCDGEHKAIVAICAEGHTRMCIATCGKCYPLATVAFIFNSLQQHPHINRILTMPCVKPVETVQNSETMPGVAPSSENGAMAFAQSVGASQPTPVRLKSTSTTSPQASASAAVDSFFDSDVREKH